MASIRPEEITDILTAELEKFERTVDTEHVGTVLQVGDGIARVYGLPDCQMGRTPGVSRRHDGPRPQP